MAQITEVLLVDDLDGGDADESVTFGLDGRFYEIDLSDKHAVELREILAPFAGAARRAGRATTSSKPASRAATTAEDRERNTEIRTWAREQGLDVSERGRIRSEVLTAFENRELGAAAPKTEQKTESKTESKTEQKTGPKTGPTDGTSVSGAEPEAPAQEKPKRARRKKAAVAS